MFFCLHSSAILAPTMRAASTLLEAASSPASACRISGFSVEEAASVRPASSSITWRQGKAGGAAARRQQAAYTLQRRAGQEGTAMTLACWRMRPLAQPACCQLLLRSTICLRTCA